MAFVKTVLGNGEIRSDYVKRRLAEGALGACQLGTDAS